MYRAGQEKRGAAGAPIPRGRAHELGKSSRMERSFNIANIPIFNPAGRTTACSAIGAFDPRAGNRSTLLLLPARGAGRKQIIAPGNEYMTPAGRPLGRNGKSKLPSVRSRPERHPTFCPASATGRRAASASDKTSAVLTKGSRARQKSTHQSFSRPPHDSCRQSQKPESMAGRPRRCRDRTFIQTKSSMKPSMSGGSAC